MIDFAYVHLLKNDTYLRLVISSTSITKNHEIFFIIIKFIVRVHKSTATRAKTFPEIILEIIVQLDYLSIMDSFLFQLFSFMSFAPFYIKFFSFSQIFSCFLNHRFIVIPPKYVFLYFGSNENYCFYKF